MDTPFVSVVLPAYNAGPYIAEAIQSILNQTYTNFELIVVNDCSTDNTEEQILAIPDARIQYIKNAQNSGLIYNLNLGFSLAKGQYIVRMDADDISLPTRIATQVAYMEANPTVGVCGTWFQSFGSQNQEAKYETENDAIKLRMLYQCHFCHPTVIIRKSVVHEHKLTYDKAFIHAEDYELWGRMAFFTSFGNIGEVLLKYRVHGENVSQKHNTVQVENSRRVIQDIFIRLGMVVSVDAIAIWVRACYADFSLTADEIRTLESLIEGLLEGNKTVNYVAQAVLEDFISQKWFNLCYNNVKNKQVQTLFNSSKISNLLPLKSRLKFRLKALA
jgi:glycosyltransferase involved in cell wall biosynthesis